MVEAKSLTTDANWNGMAGDFNFGVQVLKIVSGRHDIILEYADRRQNGIFVVVT